MFSVFFAFTHGSMGLAYLLTWMVDFYGFHVGKYTIVPWIRHGFITSLKIKTVHLKIIQCQKEHHLNQTSICLGFRNLKKILGWILSFCHQTSNSFNSRIPSTGNSDPWPRLLSTFSNSFRKPTRWIGEVPQQKSYRKVGLQGDIWGTLRIPFGKIGEPIGNIRNDQGESPPPLKNPIKILP